MARLLMGRTHGPPFGLHRLLTEDDVHQGLGPVAASRATGRTDDEETTLADLTGLGILDTAVAEFVMRGVEARGFGEGLHGLLASTGDSAG